MENNFENAFNYRFSRGFEFIGLDESGGEIFYMRCDEDAKEIYSTALDFAKRFISIDCYSLAVKDLFFNDVTLHRYKSEFIHNHEYNEYSVACQIIASICEV